MKKIHFKFYSSWVFGVILFFHYFPDHELFNLVFFMFFTFKETGKDEKMNRWKNQCEHWYLIWGPAYRLLLWQSSLDVRNLRARILQALLSWGSGFLHGMANSGAGSIRILHDPLTKPAAGEGSCIILEIVHPIRLVPFQSIRFFSSAVSLKVKQSMFRNQFQHRERRGNEANEFGLFEIFQALPIGWNAKTRRWILQGSGPKKNDPGF